MDENELMKAVGGLRGLTRGGKSQWERAIHTLASAVVSMDARIQWLEKKYAKKKKPLRTSPLKPDDLVIVGHVDGHPVYGPKEGV